MKDWIIYSIGFLAQIIFSGRLLIQWIISEKNKQVTTPSIFWKLSLLASFLLFIYGYLRNDFAIMLGQTITYIVYIRNLQLQGKWQKSPKWFRLFLYILPILVVVYTFNNGKYDIQQLLNNENIPYWLLVLGIVSQVLFTFRFIYQWMYSEKKKTSQLPAGFWRLSIVGAFLIIIYALFREDPVLLIGHGAGLIIYIRNLIIWKKQINEVA